MSSDIQNRMLVIKKSYIVNELNHLIEDDDECDNPDPSTLDIKGLIEESEIFVLDDLGTNFIFDRDGNAISQQAINEYKSSEMYFCFD